MGKRQAPRRAPAPCALLLLLVLVAGALAAGAVNVVPSQVKILQAMQKTWKTADLASLGWAEPWQCDSVQGVICDKLGNIIKLLLPGGWSLQSCNLPEIQETLWAQNCQMSNKISGSIPPVIGELNTTLRHLDLSQQLLDGTIPATIYNLTELTALILGNNAFSAGITDLISRLDKLQVLDLSSMLSMPPQPFPAGLGALVELTYLNFASADLVGDVPGNWSSLTGLQSLSLSGNNISTFPQEVLAMTNLTFLQITQTPMTGPIPDAISKLMALTHFELQLNNLTGAVPTSLTLLSNLRWLDLSYNKFLSGTISPGFSQLPIDPPENGLYKLVHLSFRNTSAVCPGHTEPACVGPPPVNTTSQFCQWVCKEFCNHCKNKTYTKDNSTGVGAGNQTYTGAKESPPPAKPPPPAPPPQADSSAPQPALAPGIALPSGSSGASNPGNTTAQNSDKKGTAAGLSHLLQGALSSFILVLVLVA